MKVSLDNLRRLIREQFEIQRKEGDYITPIYTSVVVYFYPGLDIGLQSVADYVAGLDGGAGSIEIVDGHLLNRLGGDVLFVVPRSHNSRFSDLEKIVKERVVYYPGTRKLLGGYSGGSTGVARALRSGTEFEYVVLADPTPRRDLRWDLLTYTPENWGCRQRGDGRYRGCRDYYNLDFIHNKPGTSLWPRRDIYGGAENSHQGHMRHAVDLLNQRAGR